MINKDINNVGMNQIVIIFYGHKGCYEYCSTTLEFKNKGLSIAL